MICIAFPWDDEARSREADLVALGLPPPKGRQSFRTYFRNLFNSKTEGWIDKAVKLTSTRKTSIYSAIKPKKKVAQDIPKTPSSEMTYAMLAEALGTPEEALLFVQKDEATAKQFLAFVISKRKKRGKT